MTEKGLKLIADFEGLPKKNPLDAYWDKYGKVWTIGYGATHYPDGSPVKQGDKLKSKEEAMELLKTMVKQYEDQVYKLVQCPINFYQHDALTSFAYNCGVGNLKKSTLLKKVNKNSMDPTIRDEFAKWNKSGGQVLAGLTRRRKAEADLYFTECHLQHEDGSSYTEEELATMDNADPAIVEVAGPIIVEVTETVPEPTPEPEPKKLKTLTGYLKSEGPKPENIIK